MNSLLTASEVAAILKIHINTVYYYLVAEKLKGYRVIGNRWRIKISDLETFVNGKQTANSEQVAGSVPSSKQKIRR